MSLERLLPAGLRVVGAYASPDGASAAEAAARGGLVAVAAADGPAFARGGAGVSLLPPSPDRDSVTPAGTDAWLASTHAGVRLTLRVARGRAGGRAAAAELAGDGDDAGDAVFAVQGGDGCAILLAGEEAIRLGTVDAPARATALARPPAPPGPPPAPAAVYEPGAAGDDSSPLLIDVLAFVPKGAGGAAAAAALRRALARALAAAAASPPGPARMAHFRPASWRVPVPACLPLPPGGAWDGGVAAAEDSPAATAARRALAPRLRLPTGTPHFRLGQRLHEEAPGGSGGALLNVHLSIPLASRPDPSRFTVATVATPYRYHHYCMDGFDDAGWGCAYRSLQTLASHLAAAGVARRPPPAHAEVQAALVALGDKPPGFKGSKQWVGALELSFVLDSLYSTPCKVITVPSGADMPGAARELVAHFETVGTPVMVGGGVLAYTCLGAAHDPATGDALFLILDPHYVGPDDAAPVVAGGWVAWRSLGDRAAAGGPLFVEDAFYNLLCPQRTVED